MGGREGRERVSDASVREVLCPVRGSVCVRGHSTRGQCQGYQRDFKKWVWGSKRHPEEACAEVWLV